MAVLSFQNQDRVKNLENEPEVVAQLRELLGSGDLRFLIGDIFLRLAASEPVDNAAPYTATLERLLGERSTICDASLRILMENFDYLRQYDVLMQHRRNLRKMLDETDHGWDIIRKRCQESGRPPKAVGSEEWVNANQPGQ